MNEKNKPYAMLCFCCPHCKGIIHAELFKARIKEIDKASEK